MSFAKRFIGAENLPTRLSDFDVQQSFCLSADDIAAVSERFCHDRRVPAAIQVLFLLASGRPMDRFASVPKTLLRSVCDAFQSPGVSITSLRSLYARRHTLYEHSGSDYDERQQLCSYHPKTWEPFDTVKSKADEDSDHHLVGADFEV